MSAKRALKELASLMIVDNRLVGLTDWLVDLLQIFLHTIRFSLEPRLQLASTGPTLQFEFNTPFWSFSTINQRMDRKPAIYSAGLWLREFHKNQLAGQTYMYMKGMHRAHIQKE